VRFPKRRRSRKDARLHSAEVEANGLKGRVLWADGTPPPGPDAAGSPAGPAYVLIHGIGVSHRYLRRLHGELAAAPTYSLDLPGFAGTPRPGRQLSAADYGAFIAQALKASGIDSYILVGHSMGVQFTIEAALYAPGQAQQLILMGPVVDSRHQSVLGRGSFPGRAAPGKCLLQLDRLHGLLPLRPALVLHRSARDDGLSH
jgi:pimeloyl-ACP methyl ester carboxylesterase